MQEVKTLSPDEMAATANHGAVPLVVETETITAEQLKDAPVVTTDDDKANILIVGPSGSGKSRSLKGLDPNRTIILSTEMKKMPFRGANKFKMNSKVSNFTQFNKLFDRALATDKADVIVVDSFTSLTEFAYYEIVQPLEKKESMAGWQRYKDQLHSILVKSKTSSKTVIFIAVEGETVDNNGMKTLCANVQGQLKNNVEKEFTLVLWSKVVQSGLTDDSPTQYAFMTNASDNNKAKSPEEMFPRLIPNDLANVLSWMDKYYDDDNPDYEYTGPVITANEISTTGEMPE